MSHNVREIIINEIAPWYDMFSPNPRELAGESADKIIALALQDTERYRTALLKIRDAGDIPEACAIVAEALGDL